MIIRVRVLVNLIWYSSYCHARFSVIFTPTPKHSCVQPLPQYFSARNLGALKGPGIGYLKKTPQCHGVFHSTKSLLWKFENSTAKWNGSFRFHRSVPSHRVFAYCSCCKQDTKERYWGQQFCQMEGTFWSDRPKRVDWSKRTTFKCGPKYSGRTEPKCWKWFIPFDF